MKSTAREREQERISGRTYLRDGKIIWANNRSEIVEQIPIKEIKAIGEFTTSAGPIQDDWFFVFIVGREDIRQISAYAIGIEKMLEEVGQQINADISGQLAASADWKTEILCPTTLRGQDLFKISDKRSNNWWEQIKSKIGLGKHEVELTDVLKKYLS